MKRLVQPRPPKKEVALFRARIRALEEYDLTDIMVALADFHGGTTPLYEAVEEATEEIDAR